MRRIPLLAALALIVGTTASCNPLPPTPPAPGTQCGASGPPPATVHHVVVVMAENRTWSGVGGVGFGDPTMSWLHALAVQCADYADWTETNTSQISLTQYIGLTSGIDNPNTVNDCSPSVTCRSTDNNIFRQVRTNGGTARTFVEGPTTGCSATGNAAKHIPALYYFGTYTDGTGTHNDQDFCNAEVRPLSELDPNNLPTYTMIIPDQCDDGHDLFCNNDRVNNWVGDHLQPILDGTNYKSGDTAVFVLYDEDHPVPNLIIAPTARPVVSPPSGVGHAAALRTMEELLGLPVMPQGQLVAAPSLRASANI